MAKAVAALKGEDGGDLLVIGSAELVKTLVDHDLVDEYRMMIDPLVVGGGKRLFPAAATAFFVELGLKLQGEMPMERGWVDRVVGLEGIRVDIAMLETSDGHGRLEPAKFHSPSVRGGDRNAPANTLGIRHVAFVVDDGCKRSPFGLLSGGGGI